MKSDCIILRRLHTKDGIVSPILEITDYCPTELRVELSQPSVSSYPTEAIEFSSVDDKVYKTRRYVQYKKVYAVLLEMREE